MLLSGARPSRRAVHVLVTLVLAVLLGLLAPTPALAAGSGVGSGTGSGSHRGTAHRAEAAPSLTISAPIGWPDREVPVRVVLSDGGQPVPGAAIVLERRTPEGWRQVAEGVTDAEGAVVAPVLLDRTPFYDDVRATAAAAGERPAVTATARLRFRPRTPRVLLQAPRSVVDERTVRLVGTWTAGGDPVDGSMRVEQRRAGEGWRPAGWIRTGADGVGSLTLRPRVDTRYRLRTAARGSWLLAGRSAERLVDNRPPFAPVVPPAGAPRPTVSVPVQPRADRPGAHPVITSIPDAVWRDMVGRSWHRGCPVGRSGLRLLRINYVGFDGYRHRGELVAATGAIRRMAAALADMHDRGLPLRSLYRVDRFGWSASLRGANDHRSMAADNTSAFNCRGVVGNPGVRSPHSSGRALDVNPWENPYRSRRGVVPNTWWLARSDARYAWRSRSHVVVRIMAAHGLRWTYGNGDTQHFDV
ncbi:M15 family metallopeptidase [Nocardioides sp. TRM66260-LWL]|uniref:M15 family metallopeptidase n=1 Tax=Nocardioides sp. TRM66260-LWL TaxID=2874478 RepID=UPI001CC5C35B|nr:M15 family metallopeptidase [Nocardioides sp. TRM66260-LWL]MBZ5732923.1 M15 family metallopeptidase [Nocardioides sp. TRM66260-LWL]